MRKQSIWVGPYGATQDCEGPSYKAGHTRNWGPKKEDEEMSGKRINASFPKTMKDIKPQTRKAQGLPSSINKVKRTYLGV